MSTADRIEAESHKDPARLEREIDQQRADIDHIVDALENKLSPGQLFDRLVNFGKGNGSELAQNFGATIKAHPLPALLTSVGLAWLYASRNDPAPGSADTGFRRSGYVGATAMSTGRETSGDDSDIGLGQRAQDLGDQTSDKVGQVTDKVSDTWDQATARASQLSDRMTDKLHHATDTLQDASATVSAKARQATDTVRQQGMRAKQGFNQMLNDNPLALGAIGMALGAILAAALPITEQENQLLGKASDRVTDKAKDAVRSTVADARETVHEATTREPGTRTH